MKAKTFLILMLFVSVSIEAQESKLIGYWQLSNVVVGDETQQNLKAVFIFEKDGVIKAARSVEERAVAVGTWHYQNKILLMNSKIDKDFRGEALIIQVSKDKLVYEKEEAVFSFFRLNSDAFPKLTQKEVIERPSLDFSESDFFNDDGNYLYDEDELKLPWQDSYKMIHSLKHVKHLVYNYAVFIESTNKFENKTLTADVRVCDENQTLIIDYIFFGYDRYNLPEDAELPPNISNSRPLYPEKDNIFRIVGSEEISIAAGTFDCTVIEMLGEFEVKKKLWMINNKPGVYAKIIEDKPGDFGRYAIYELQEIK
jgi:hypothetical protein